MFYMYYSRFGLWVLLNLSRFQRISFRRSDGNVNVENKMFWSNQSSCLEARNEMENEKKRMLKKVQTGLAGLKKGKRSKERKGGEKGKDEGME